MSKYIDEHPTITKEIALDVMADFRKGLNNMNEIGVRETKISCSKYMIDVLDFAIEYLRGENEQIHGKWIDDGLRSEAGNAKLYSCSNCSYRYVGFGKEFLYCPSCGAKMDGENE